MINNQYQATHISAGTTTQVFSGQGVLHAINVNSSTGTIMGIYDGIAVTTTPIALLKASIAEGSYNFDCTIATGLYITTGASGDYTVTWSRG